MFTQPLFVMRRVRVQEQLAAAITGRYAAMIQLSFPSSAVKSSDDK
jgi:hypothetical protein